MLIKIQEQENLSPRKGREWANLFIQCFTLLVIATPSFGGPSMWEATNAAGMQAFQQKKYRQAKNLFLEALNHAESFEDPNAKKATTLNNLAASHEALGEYEEAELRYRQSLTIVEVIQGPNHPDVVLGLNNLASLHFAKGEFEKAEPLWIRALSILEKFLGPQHPHLTPTLTTLALVSQAQGKHNLAESRLKRALQITETHLGPQHPQLAKLLDQYAHLLRSTNRQEEAELVENQARSIRSQLSSPP